MYTDLLTRIKNAQAVKKESLKVPFSNNDMKIAELLAKNGYLTSVEKKGRMPKRIIDITLKYDDNDRGAISGVKFVSVPSRRIYCGYNTLRLVKNGFGTALVSTSKGIMTNRQARKEKVGGQILFEIW
jgi:small subunit ribosomal protein S8